MKKVLSFLIVFCISGLSAQTYCVGDYIGLYHQNEQFGVCYSSDGYSVGDQWKLADYNGELNGGDYHILFIDISASW